MPKFGGAVKPVGGPAGDRGRVVAIRAGVAERDGARVFEGTGSRTGEERHRDASIGHGRVVTARR